MTSEAEFIPAETPLLWAAGLGFYQLQERWAHVVSVDGGGAPNVHRWLNSEEQANQYRLLTIEVNGMPAESTVQRVMMLAPPISGVLNESAIVIAIPPVAKEPKPDEAPANDENSDAETDDGSNADRDE